MATQKAQRFGIWFIVVFMIIGTIGSFGLIVLANKNDAADAARVQKLEAQYKKEANEYKLKSAAQASELSDKYFATFAQFQDRVGPFAKDDVKELSSEDLLAGDGEVITKDSVFHAYYLGWNPDGKIFDGSIEGEALKAPFGVTPGGVIEGWTKGLEGIKTGGVRLLAIPSDLAYGEQGSGEDIPANTPLKFIVMVIPSPENIPMPNVPEELYKYYQRQGMM